MHFPLRSFTRRTARALGRLAVFFLLCYLALVGFLAATQHQLIYRPMKVPPAELATLAQAYGAHPWHPLPGAPARGWISNASTTGVGLVMLHGNAGFALHRTLILQRFQQAPGIGPALVLEYPGYGGRGGEDPAADRIIDEAVAAIQNWAAQTGGPIVLVGESLGSALAAQAAARRPDLVRGLLLITPMNRLSDVAAHHFPFFPVRWILRERLDAETALRHYPGPVALVIAEQDEVIPPHLGLHLLSAAQGPIKPWIVPGTTHNTLSYASGEGPWDAALAFLLASGPSSP